MKEFNPILFSITAYALSGSAHLETLGTTFLAKNVESASVVVSSSRPCHSFIECGAFCKADPNCSMLDYSRESGICKFISRDGFNEPIQLPYLQGVVKFVDTSQPCKFSL